MINFGIDVLGSYVKSSTDEILTYYRVSVGIKTWKWFYGKFMY